MAMQIKLIVVVVVVYVKSAEFTSDLIICNGLRSKTDETFKRNHTVHAF